MDHILTINQAIQKFTEYNHPLYIALVNYEKTFDSVKTLAIMQALRNQGREEPFVKILSPILITTCLQEVFRGLDWEQFWMRVNEEYLSNL